jgi:hypothetical protein
MNIDFLKETSVEHSNLTEGITAGDIAQTDEIVNAIIETKQYESLAYQICEVSPIHGPTGATFALVYRDNKFQLLRGNVVVEEDVMENTGFTKEAVQDLYSQFGKSATDFIARSFGGVSNMNENRKLIAKMSDFAAESADLYLSDPSNAETTMFEIQQKVAQLVLLINSTSFKSLDSFVVMPLRQAASMLAISNRLPENKKEKGLYLGSNSRTKFYLNPDVSSDEFFVGIYSSVPGQSSLVMSPYFHTIVTATDPKTGNENIFNFNRYAITESKLSEVQKMLYKFKITTNTVNQPPVAVIKGGDVTTTVGTEVKLDGSSSHDAETDTLTYKWTLLSKPSTSSTDIEYDPTIPINDIIPDVAGDYIVQLVVGDGTDYSDPAKITITAS